MRSEFENYLRNTLFYSNMLASAAESGVAIKPFEKFKGQYRNTYVQLAYSVYSHQQSKVDELQNRVDELENALSYIYMNAESTYCSSCRYAESEAASLGCGLEQALKGGEA